VRRPNKDLITHIECCNMILVEHLLFSYYKTDQKKLLHSLLVISQPTVLPILAQSGNIWNRPILFSIIPVQWNTVYFVAQDAFRYVYNGISKDFTNFPGERAFLNPAITYHSCIYSFLASLYLISRKARKRPEDLNIRRPL